MSSVRVIGDDEVADFLRGLNRNIDRVGRSWLRDNAIDGVKSVQKYILNVGAIDTNELVQGFNYDIDRTSKGLQATIKPSAQADKYAWFVEAGTRPHRAPIDALQGWADRHGIPVGAVWYKIATEGTDPRWFARDSFNDEIKPNVTRDANRLLDRLVGGI